MFNEWYLARSSDSNWICAYPTSLTGIRKYKGCCFYAPTVDLVPLPDKGEDATQWGIDLRESTCKQIFGHCPKKGELLCVKKTRSGRKATKIDLEFSN